MENKLINVLQIGKESWDVTQEIPSNLRWFFLDSKDLSLFSESLDHLEEWFQLPGDAKLKFDGFLLTDKDYPEDLLNLDELIQPYTVFYNIRQEPSSEVIREFLYRKGYHPIYLNSKSEVIHLFSKILFTGQYGMKFHVDSLTIPTDLQSQSIYKGHYYLDISSVYGSEFRPIASMRANHPYDMNHLLELWWELNAAETVELMVKVTLIRHGSADDILRKWTISGDELKMPYTIDYVESGHLAITLFARGHGSVKIGPAHFRHGRAGFGEFILGGERYVDYLGQEFMTYFELGDFKPPLNVYFAGYRSAEGFEGYFMMKKMGAPFLLICDPRLEGGAFYIGSAEFESELQRVIEEKLSILGFTKDQLILSGLSMGTYGAMYYGAKLMPHAIIVGKPLINLGTIAENLQFKRPDEFATSLDLLQLKEGDLSMESVERMNQYFWKTFKEANLSNTLLAVAYMQHDDYDTKAYQELLEYEAPHKPKIIGKGWIGRHNDNSGAIINWFLNQYAHIMEKGFKRNSKSI